MLCHDRIGNILLDLSYIFLFCLDMSSLLLTICLLDMSWQLEENERSCHTCNRFRSSICWFLLVFFFVNLWNQHVSDSNGYRTWQRISFEKPFLSSDSSLHYRSTNVCFFCLSSCRSVTCCQKDGFSYAAVKRKTNDGRLKLTAVHTLGSQTCFSSNC